MVSEIGHEAYIGKDLIAAVVANVYETSRNVYLPEGGWYDFHTDQYHPALPQGGGQWVKDVSVKPDGKLALPLFAREGAIIPLDRVTSGGTHLGSEKEMRLRVFGSKTSSEATIVEDDGATRGYENGESRKTLVTQEKTANGYDVTIYPTQGGYGGVSKVRSTRVEMVVPEGKISAVKISGKPVAWAKGVRELSGKVPVAYYDPATHLVTLYMPPGTRTGRTTYSFITSGR